MLPSSSAAAGDLAVLVTRGSSTSNFKGLSSYSVQQMLCRKGGDFFMVITTLALEASSVLSMPVVPGELAEKGCVCSLVLVCCQRRLLFSGCNSFPPAGKGYWLSIAVRSLLVDTCNFLLLCQTQNSHVVWEVFDVLALGWIFKQLTSQERCYGGPRLCS